MTYLSKQADSQCLSQAEKEDSVELSDGMGPDGWDDVLSAWMSNAGLLGNGQPHGEDEAPAR